MECAFADDQSAVVTTRTALSAARDLRAAYGRTRARARRTADLWYEFQELRCTRDWLWRKLQEQFRLLHLEQFGLKLTTWPVSAFVPGAFGIPRLVRRPALAGGDGLNDRPANMLVCTLASRDGAAILSVSGELDLAAASSFVNYLKRASDRGAHVVLDLSGLRYMDSTGINALLNAREKFARTGQRIVLASVPPMIRRILGVVAVEDVIPVFETVDAAVESLGSRPRTDSQG